MFSSQPNRSQILLPIIGLLVVGCKDPYTKDPDVGECTPLPGEPCDEPSTDDASSSETGGDDETGGNGGSGDDGETSADHQPIELGSDECQHNYDPGIVGIQYQCEGDLHTSLEFTVKGDSCSDLLGAGWCAHHDVFGVNFQPYAAAEVIACCGEYDFQYVAKYKEFCVYDMYQQFCSSLAKRLQAAINEGQFGIYGAQIAKIQVWIAEHYEECFSSLLDNNTAMLPEVISHWKLGDFGDLHGVVLHIDAPTEIDGVNLPMDEAEWLSCNSAHGNDDEVFEDHHTPNGGVTVGVNLTTDLDADLVGPSILGGAVTASATFDAGCGPRGCSAAEFSHDPESLQFTMEELDLFEVDPVVMTNGTFALAADRAQMRLWSQAIGHKVLDPDSGQILRYEIPAGAAQFMVSGLAANYGSNRFLVLNSTDIWITQANGMWDIDSFDVAFEDGGNNLWTITLDNSRWDE
jgi:hypothetical protein